MIEYHYETDFSLNTEKKYTEWLKKVIRSEDKELDTLSYIFYNDEQLRAINKEYLHHDEYTDIITFNYNTTESIAGDIFISVERVKENALKYNTLLEEEIRRVMVHGVLHLMGYDDKTKGDSDLMRGKEEEKINMFHVEQ
jgi:rRNA maturation RNase YbeY